MERGDRLPTRSRNDANCVVIGQRIVDSEERRGSAE
jgi:hypothetical protein